MDENLTPPSPEHVAPQDPKDVSRRVFLMNVGIALNAIVGIAIATPVAVYLMGPVIRRKEYRHWISLGDAAEFHPGETKLVTFRNPFRQSTDGVTANVPAYVRCTAPGKFVVFAINCAHLGCPVRWFSESQLFMCPCHGGVYYADGSRASGPPERGLFTYEAKIEDGQLMIDAGQMPTLSNRAGAGPCPGMGPGAENGSQEAKNLVTRIAPWPGTKTPTIG
jgi:Rieske Fe-S protein